MTCVKVSVFSISSNKPIKIFLKVNVKKDDFVFAREPKRIMGIRNNMTMDSVW